MPAAPPHDSPSAPTGLAAARRAVSVAFIASGFAFASWAARIPQVRDRLEISPGRLGLLLLSVAAGSVLGIPASGRIVARLGEARTVATSSVLLGTGLATVAIGYEVGVAPVVVGLFLFGVGNGVWDVAMNVQGATVERGLSRSILPRFHAGWSVGTVAGAGIGTVMVALRVNVTLHLLVVAVAVAAVVPLTALRGFLRDSATDATSDTTAGHPPTAHEPVRSAWRERRTLLIGVFVLCMAFTEGTGNDWLSVAVIDGYRTPAAQGTIAFAVFLAAMTTGRWFGPAALDRHGRVVVLRISSVAALAGLLVVSFGQIYPLALVGAVLWGLGASLGFPTGIGAAADDPARAAARVSVAASIAYVAFLAGPPVIGFVGDHIGVLHGLLVAAALLAVAAMLCGACAPLPPAEGAVRAERLSDDVEGSEEVEPDQVGTRARTGNV